MRMPFKNERQHSNTTFYQVINMNEQKERSLGRLIANLESDPDIQTAIQAQRTVQVLADEAPRIEAFKQRAFRIVEDAMDCYQETSSSQQAAAVPVSTSSPIHAHDLVNESRDKAVSLPKVGLKTAGKFIQEAASVLASGLSDFLLPPSPFGKLQAMMGRSGAGIAWKLRIQSLGVRITFRKKDARGEQAFARVVSLRDGEVSRVLDGGTVIVGGYVVGKFTNGCAEFPASAVVGQIALRDSQGNPLDAKEENAS